MSDFLIKNTKTPHHTNNIAEKTVESEGFVVISASAHRIMEHCQQRKKEWGEKTQSIFPPKCCSSIKNLSYCILELFFCAREISTTIGKWLRHFLSHTNTHVSILRTDLIAPNYISFFALTQSLTYQNAKLAQLKTRRVKITFLFLKKWNAHSW